MCFPAVSRTEYWQPLPAPQPDARDDVRRVQVCAAGGAGIEPDTPARVPPADGGGADGHHATGGRRVQDQPQRPGDTRGPHCAHGQRHLHQGAGMFIP